MRPDTIDEGGGVYEFGPYRLDLAEHRLTRGGRPVVLSAKVFELLAVLVANSGRLLRKDELMQALWPDRVVEENNLTVSVSALRKALGRPRGGARAYIETVPKAGYRFSAPVRRVSSAPSAAPPTGAGADGGAGADPIDSVAVLPLLNVGGSEEDEYLSDGITESIISSLSRLPRLKVLARSTVFRFKGQEALDVREVGRRLHVRALLTGRLFRLDGRLVVSAELVNVADGAQLWGGRYTLRPADPFAVQEELAAAVSAQLRLRLTGAEQSSLARRHTESPEAYDLYLRGRYFWNMRSAEAVRKAVELFQRAAEADPSYALAYVGLADAHTALCALGVVAPHEGYPLARAAARAAVALEEQLAEAHASLGIIALRYDFDVPAAEDSLRRAIALNPSYAVAHLRYSHCLAARRRHDEALEVVRKALRLDPLSLFCNAMYAVQYYLARRYDEAIEQYSRAQELDPNFIYAHTGLGESYYYAGRHEEAVALMEHGARVFGWDTWQSLSVRGFIYAATGRADDARPLLDELIDRHAREFVSAYEIAKVLVTLGEHELALDWLDLAHEQRDGDLIFIHCAVELDPLREHPRFKELVRRVGIPL